MEELISEMDISGILTLSISGGALVLSIYGVAERRNSDTRNERVRFGQLVEELNKTLDDFNRVSSELEQPVTTKLELLTSQALSLANRFPNSITSSEFRVLAYSRERAGFLEDSDTLWAKALSKARTEGDIRILFILRGYALSKYGRGRYHEARELFLQSRRHVRDDADLALTLLWQINKEFFYVPSEQRITDGLFKDFREAVNRIQLEWLRKSLTNTATKQIRAIESSGIKVRLPALEGENQQHVE